MSWADEQDRLKKAVVTSFAVAATYETEAGVVTAINGALRSGEAYEQLQGRGAEAELFVRLVDLPTVPAKFDRVTIAGKVYRMAAEPIRDGAGGARLLLRFIEDVPSAT